MAQILAIAREVLAGEIAMEDCQPDAAVEHFATAVRLEDELTYVEPSDWYVPARHHLGLALLAVERPAEAEAVYRKDLEIYPDNGWSLVGLEQSLAVQRKTAEAKDIRLRFERVWARADVEIEGSRL